MTHDRDGWPEPRLINGIYRVEPRRGPNGTWAEDWNDPAMDVYDGPPYADMEQRVPDAWSEEPTGSFRRGLLFGCGTELAALLLVLAFAFLLGHATPSGAAQSPSTVGLLRGAPLSGARISGMAQTALRERAYEGGAPSATGPASAGVPPVATLRGWATHYADPRKSGLYAAAGPVLRQALGSSWRGKTVTVCAASCVTVRLSDWCGCGPRHGTPTLIDVSPAAFSRLAPLSAGIVRVTITLGGRVLTAKPVPTAPPTDVMP